jgi:hypothetical protein
LTVDLSEEEEEEEEEEEKMMMMMMTTTTTTEMILETSVPYRHLRRLIAREDVHRTK